MKKFLLLPLVMLSGCAIHAVPVTPRFPEAPATLQEKCEALKEVASDSTLTEFTRTVVENYVLYHECSRKVEGWNEWYTRQREIAETASKK